MELCFLILIPPGKVIETQETTEPAKSPEEIKSNMLLFVYPREAYSRNSTYYWKRFVKSLLTSKFS